jgi:hypothetical protein
MNVPETEWKNPCCVIRLRAFFYLAKKQGIERADKPAHSMPRDEIPCGEKLGTVSFHEIKNGKPRGACESDWLKTKSQQTGGTL